MSEIKLLPCPFCGGTVKMYSTKIDAIQEFHEFHCDRCNMTISYDYPNKEEAIEKWNTRITKTPLKPRLRVGVRRKMIYDFIKKYIEENGYSPKYEEISSAVGIGTSGVSKHLLDLQVAGLIRRDHSGWRNISLPET